MLPVCRQIFYCKNRENPEVTARWLRNSNGRRTECAYIRTSACDFGFARLSSSCLLRKLKGSQGAVSCGLVLATQQVFTELAVGTRTR